MTGKQTHLHEISMDEERFKNLFHSYFASMCVFAERYLEDREAAKDVVHDVFCRIWEKPEELMAVDSVKNYLYMVVKNRCLNVLRRQCIHHLYSERSLLEVKGSDLFFEKEVAREELYRLLEKAIYTLPDRSQKILLLKLQGLKNQEIAERLNVSVNTVNTLKANAYKVIRVLLKDKYFLCYFLFLQKKRILIHYFSE